MYLTQPQIHRQLSPSIQYTNKPLHRATTQSAGWDIHSTKEYIIPPGERAMIDTGVIISLNPGTYGKIEGRSSLAKKHGILVGGGVIDSDYNGEVKVILINTGVHNFVVEKDAAIAQLIIIPYYNGIVQNALQTSVKREGGFGSTDIRTYMESTKQDKC